MDPNPLFRTAFRALVAPLALSLLLVACGGSETEMEIASSPAMKRCDNTVPPGTGDDDPSCGDVLVGVTDADGDFVAYEVDVVALTLTRQDGARVELLPATTRIDFAQLTQLTDLLTAARVSPGVYTAATLTLDYSTANVVVESGGAAVSADVVLPPGRSDGMATLEVALAVDHPLVVMAGTPALLTLDFDLQASHTVDLGPNPPQVHLDRPVLFATLDADLDGREHRARGPLVSVSLANSSYMVALRPWFGRNGHYGRLNVHTTDTTTFEIDGVSSTGAVGLTALSLEPQGTATLAFGRYDTAVHGFVATRVYAGSSVPGDTLDGALGAVRARLGDTLTLSGATFIRASGSFGFARDVSVVLDGSTAVRIAGSSSPGTLASISVGSRVEVLGTATVALDGAVSVAAELVRVVPTGLTATVVGVAGTTLTVDLQSLDGRRPAQFDFSGTGTDPAHDADPHAYEIAMNPLFDAVEAGIHVGSPIGVLGWVDDFGTAPADLDATTLVDYSSAHALIVVGWGADGTTAPFTAHAAGGVQVDLGNPAVGLLHHLVRGPVVTDLRALASSPTIVAADASLGFAVRRNGMTTLYTDFSGFVAAVQAGLDAHLALHAYFVRGTYDAAQVRLAAYQALAVFD